MTRRRYVEVHLDGGFVAPDDEGRGQGAVSRAFASDIVDIKGREVENKTQKHDHISNGRFDGIDVHVQDDVEIAPGFTTQVRAHESAVHVSAPDAAQKVESESDEIRLGRWMTEADSKRG